MLLIYVILISYLVIYQKRGLKLHKKTIKKGEGGYSYNIESKFKIKCYVGDAWARVVYQDGLKPVLRQIAPRMSVAIGLAMRSMVQ